MRATDLWAPTYRDCLERYVVLAKAEPLRHEPEVELDFHTYRGFLVVFEQARHRHTLPARHVLLLAEALHRRNLKFCLVPYPGIAFVPFLSWMNLRRMRARVRKALG
jgi:hypothetical protein